LASNLIANALVHGSAKSPVKVSAGADIREVVLDRWNDDIPISAEAIRKNLRSVLVSGHIGEHQGLGMGVHIGPQIVRAHGGTISVTSDKAHGTRFLVRLPLLIE
jgi:sigma-B regulation protein RsbU (phosphoserine phosphatase)